MSTKTSSFLSDTELAEIGFKSIGKGCLISRYARFYGASEMAIGNKVRIDDFCMLSGKITLGNNIHISAYVALYGAKGITIEDYSGISARSTIYSAMDDFGGDYMIGPMSPEGTTNVTGGPVRLCKFVQIGAHCLVFPNLTISEGVVVGAASLVREDLAPWGIYFGSPARFHRERSKQMCRFVGKH